MKIIHASGRTTAMGIGINTWAPTEDCSPRQIEIREMHARIDQRRRAAFRDLERLQQECSHPNAAKTHKSNTGNYDPTSDCYWTVFDCADCGKRWSEDGSK